MNEKGMQTRREVLGDEHVDRAIAATTDFTAPTVHSGFAGTITLELINLGPLDILLHPRMPICQLIVEQVFGTPFRNDSQFQGQARAGGKTPPRPSSTG